MDHYCTVRDNYPESSGEKDNQQLLELIRGSWSLSGGIYGYR
ncbi:hypothetical protein [Salmonella enterica]|nr:hypothetical protein [Salmonella enterica]